MNAEHIGNSVLTFQNLISRHIEMVLIEHQETLKFSLLRFQKTKEEISSRNLFMCP